MIKFWVQRSDFKKSKFINNQLNINKICFWIILIK